MIKYLGYFLLGFFITAGVSWCADPANAFEESMMEGAVGYLTRIQADGQPDYLVMYEDGTLVEFDAVGGTVEIHSYNSIHEFAEEQEYSEEELNDVFMDFYLRKKLGDEEHLPCLGAACP